MPLNGNKQMVVRKHHSVQSPITLTHIEVVIKINLKPD